MNANEGGYVKPLETYLHEVVRRAWVDDVVSRIAMMTLLFGATLLGILGSPMQVALIGMTPLLLGTLYYSFAWTIRRREDSALTRRLMRVLMRDEQSIDYLIGSGLESRGAAARRDSALSLVEPLLWAALVFASFAISYVARATQF